MRCAIRLLLLGVLSFTVTAVCAHAGSGLPAKGQARLKPSPRTVEQVQTALSETAEVNVKRLFEKAGVAYPPAALTFIGLKAEKQLEVWAQPQAGAAWVHVSTYPVLAASGGPGPKLQQGDFQVPEGIYQLEYLNPNSSYHLSMKINYPNAEDRKHGKAEGRQNLGGDIFIHGQAVSIGCLAVGDHAIEELFSLVARTGVKHVTVLLSPYDFRHRAPARSSDAPAWIDQIYEQLEQRLALFKSH